MSKPFASRRFGLAGWVLLGSIAAVAVLAAGIMASVSLLAHRGSTAAQPVAPTHAVLNAEPRSRVQASLGALPLAFEANQGQTDPQVKYMARGNGYTVFLTANDTVFALQSLASKSAEKEVSAKATTTVKGHEAFAKARPKPAAKDATAAIRMHLVGSNAQPQISAGDQLPGHSNYFIGNDRSQWHSNVAQFARVSYRDVYPGVNLAFYGKQKQLEFDFIVAPGASITPIRLAVSGAKHVITDDSGNLILASSAGDVLLHKPVAYQQKDGARQPVDARFVLQAHNQVSFELGSYDRSRELVIDPAVSYATYLGGTEEDDGYAIAIDSSGDVYVTGQTKSTNFPGANAADYAGGFDVFVAKIKADGSALIYSTYVGGSGDDSGNAIAVDGSGNAFVAGGTGSSTNFPTTASASQKSFGGGSLDAFVFELASSGGSLTYSTYLGGSGDDVATGLALAKDGSGDTFVVGSTGSSNFPTTAGTIQTTIKGTSNGFVTKLNSSGSARLYSTYLGGGSGDFASAVTVDSSNDAFVTGATQNSTFPTTLGAFQTTCGTAANCNGGLSDAFISVLKPDASNFVYSTFLGGSNADQGLGIAVDSAGDAYVTGLTQSSDFKLMNAMQGTFGGGTQDAFVSALNPAGSKLLYSTYLGGNQNDGGAGIAVDGNNNVYVTGQTASPNFPTTTNATQGTLGGGNDAFVTQINPSGSFMFSTYLGGSLNEDSTAGGPSFSPTGAIAVDSAGANIYVTGNTASTNFPATAGSKQTANGGGTDAFVAKYSLTASGPDFTIAGSPLPTTTQGGTSTSTITITAVNNYSGTVNFTCSVAAGTGGSPLPTCSIPTAVTGGAGTSTLSVTTTGTAGAMNHGATGLVYAMWLPVVGLSLVGMRFSTAGSRRKKLLGFLLLGLIMAALFFLPACGSSSSNGGGGSCPGCTPQGTYTVTVTGTDSALTHSVNLTLTVN